MSTYLGLDLGQLQDYSALAVVREVTPHAPPPPPTVLFNPADLSTPSVRLLNGQPAPPARQDERDQPLLRVTYLHRWPLGTKYARIVEAMGAFLGSPLAGDARSSRSTAPASAWRCWRCSTRRASATRR